MSQFMLSDQILDVRPLRVMAVIWGGDAREMAGLLPAEMWVAARRASGFMDTLEVGVLRTTDMPEAQALASAWGMRVHRWHGLQASDDDYAVAIDVLRRAAPLAMDETWWIHREAPPSAALRMFVACAHQPPDVIVDSDALWGRHLKLLRQISPIRVLPTADCYEATLPRSDGWVFDRGPIARRLAAACTIGQRGRMDALTITRRYVRFKSTRLGGGPSEGSAVVDWANALVAGTFGALLDARSTNWTPNEWAALEVFALR